MADTNKVSLSGIAVAKPVLTKLPGRGLPMAWFDLLVREDYQSKGRAQARAMAVRIEALGKQAPKVYEDVKEGLRYDLDGYLMWDAEAGFRVRVFSVRPDTSDDAVAYSEGLRSALDLVRKSPDVKAATEAIRTLLTQDERS